MSKMNDCVRIVPFKAKGRLCLYPMWYMLQMKKVWLRVGPLKFFKWETIGEYCTYDCAVLDAKIAVKCLKDGWKENNNAQ